MLSTPLSTFLQGWPPNSHNIKPINSQTGSTRKRKVLQKAINAHKVTWTEDLPLLIDQDLTLEEIPRTNSLQSMLTEILTQAHFGTDRLSMTTTRNVRRILDTSSSSPLLSRIPISCQQAFYTNLWKIPIDHKHRIIWWKLSLNRIPTRKHLYRLFPTKFTSSLCPICNTSIEDIDHFIFFCPTKNRFWKYVRTIINIWTIHEPHITMQELTPDMVISGFQHLWYNLSLKRNPTTVIICSIAFGTLWNAHWQFIFDEDPSKQFHYDILVNTFWASLHRRMQEDTIIQKSNSIWLRQRIVTWTLDKVQINKPLIFIHA
jgi:hypothetical protein